MIIQTLDETLIQQMTLNETLIQTLDKMGQHHLELAQHTKPSPENDHGLTKWQWAFCNLVALLYGSGCDFSSFKDWVYNLDSQGPPALCNLSRDKLNTHIGIQARGLPSADIDNQVKTLQDKVKTHTGKAFVFHEAGPKDLKPINREPVDYITWILKVTHFEVDWADLDEKSNDLYVAILLGLVLGRLGKVIGASTSITDAIPGVLEQYERGEGLLPYLNVPQRTPPPGSTFPPPRSTFPPPAPQPAPQPAPPQHSRLYSDNLLAAVIVFLFVMQVLFLLMVMATFIAQTKK
ncbi:hypothetical protein QQZ08_011002 [Neonectria magnoliae]|uniref:Uncharacterized protein n=1 Tax=Neonectria magnoliae TaxID=2732573 RepID=A0ABR1HDG8_9HYPO